jgi:isopenicillin-N epimerase
VTSPTGLIFPVADLCARARAAKILTLVDGAHAPGQIPLDLAAVGADCYTGNCHKWLCAPKGAAFLYVRPEVQDRIEPLIVSWGSEAGHGGPTRFIEDLEYTGTRDIAAYLSVPAAIDFQARHDWDGVRRRCHELLRRTRVRLLALPEVTALHPDDPTWYAQMEAVQLPPCDPLALQAELFERFRVEVPGILWNDRPLLRVAIQGYNTEMDVDALMAALSDLLYR